MGLAIFQTYCVSLAPNLWLSFQWHIEKHFALIIVDDRHHKFCLQLRFIEARECSSGIGWLEVCCCQPPSNITMWQCDIANNILRWFTFLGRLYLCKLRDRSPPVTGRARIQILNEQKTSSPAPLACQWPGRLALSRDIPIFWQL